MPVEWSAYQSTSPASTTTVDLTMVIVDRFDGAIMKRIIDISRSAFHREVERLTMGWLGLYYTQNGKSKKGKACLCALNSVGDLVAFGLITYKKRVANIDKIAVHIDYRRQRIADRMLDTALDYIRDVLQGPSKHVKLQVDASNTTAINLYQKKGFRVKKRVVDYYGAGEDALAMMVRL